MARGCQRLDPTRRCHTVGTARIRRKTPAIVSGSPWTRSARQVCTSVMLSHSTCRLFTKLGSLPAGKEEACAHHRKRRLILAYHRRPWSRQGICHRKIGSHRENTFWHSRVLIVNAAWPAGATKGTASQAQSVSPPPFSPPSARRELWFMITGKRYAFNINYGSVPRDAAINAGAIGDDLHNAEQTVANSETLAARSCILSPPTLPKSNARFDIEPSHVSVGLMSEL
jgi:hypothetical protein